MHSLAAARPKILAAFATARAFAAFAAFAAVAASLLADTGHDGAVSAAVLTQLRDGLERLGMKADHTEIYRAITGDPPKS